MSKKIILFDWDDTLFSKKLYKGNLWFNLAKICGIRIEEATVADNEYFDNLINSGDFEIEDYLKNFERRFGKKIKLENFNTDKWGIYSKALFTETIEVLEKMKRKYIFGIYSQGFESLQRLKIRYSGIEGYFDKDLVFIDREKNKPDFVVKLPFRVMVIDDKKEVIETLANARPDLTLVWINRIDEEKIETPQIRTIKKLEELSAIY